MDATTRHPPLGERASKRAAYHGERRAWKLIVCTPIRSSHRSNAENSDRERAHDGRTGCLSITRPVSTSAINGTR
jgi:hypothetical protein